MDTEDNPIIGNNDMMNGEMNDNIPPLPNNDNNNLDDNDEGFDAGIDTDKEEDPKKYLQQLTGKLSQELRSYNQDQEKPDTELNKYVAGMIIPQATKDMTDKEKKEVISKIESNSAEDENGIGDDFIGQDEDMNNSQDENMPMESTRKINKIVNEIVNSFNDDKKERNDKKIKVKNNKINPFVSEF